MCVCVCAETHARVFLASRHHNRWHIRFDFLNMGESVLPQDKALKLTSFLLKDYLKDNVIIWTRPFCDLRNKHNGVILYTYSLVLLNRTLAGSQSRCGSLGRWWQTNHTWVRQSWSASDWTLVIKRTDSEPTPNQICCEYLFAADLSCWNKPRRKMSQRTEL